MGIGKGSSKLREAIYLRDLEMGRFLPSRSRWLMAGSVDSLDSVDADQATGKFVDVAPAAAKGMYAGFTITDAKTIEISGGLDGDIWRIWYLDENWDMKFDQITLSGGGVGTSSVTAIRLNGAFLVHSAHASGYNVSTVIFKQTGPDIEYGRVLPYTNRLHNGVLSVPNKTVALLHRFRLDCLRHTSTSVCFSLAQRLTGQGHSGWIHGPASSATDKRSFVSEPDGAISFAPKTDICPRISEIGANGTGVDTFAVFEFARVKG